jgi:hypothetical protein
MSTIKYSIENGYKYDDVFTHSGLSAACDEPFDSELTAEGLSRDE